MSIPINTEALSTVMINDTIKNPSFLQLGTIEGSLFMIRLSIPQSIVVKTSKYTKI